LPKRLFYLRRRERGPPKWTTQTLRGGGRADVVA
jgi:hypothetical protein